MKKIICPLLIFCILLGGCSKKKNKSNPAQTPSSSLESTDISGIDDILSSIIFEPDMPSGLPISNSLYLKLNEEFTKDNLLAIDIKAQEITQIFGLAFQINFDPALLTYGETKPGDLFGNKSGEMFSHSGLEDGRNDKLLFGISKLRGAAEVSGSGTIATFTFTRKSPGGSTLQFENNQARNSENNDVPGLNWYGGKVTFR